MKMTSIALPIISCSVSPAREYAISTGSAAGKHVVQLYFQSTTPMITDLETDILNNEIIREFDGQLQAYCNENGYHYIDLYHQMCDDTGALRDDYCVDPDADGVHFTDEACIIWANYLKTAVAG